MFAKMDRYSAILIGVVIIGVLLILAANYFDEKWYISLLDRFGDAFFITGALGVKAGAIMPH